MKREEAIETVLDYIASKDIVVATTGKTGRELFELREKRKESHRQDFLNIGAMGHASMITLGIALAKPRRTVWCLDGDGALVMHMGALAIVGATRSNNVRHIVLNNGCHDSVGGQPTAGFAIDIPAIAYACGYRMTARAASIRALQRALQKMCAHPKGPALIEVIIKPGSRADLGRPALSPQDMKKAFTKFVQ
jgi:phosphonopyruvate decarboxylase